MRPTIPLGPWRLAIDLAATRTVNALETVPTHGCTCGDCRLWAATHATVLPASLLTELRRVGVDPARPAEVYVLEAREASFAVRAGYFAVGRILSGPAELRHHPETGAGRLYHSLRTGPHFLALAVAQQEHVSPAPDWVPAALAPLLAIDLFMVVARTRALDAVRGAVA